MPSSCVGGKSFSMSKVKCPLHWRHNGCDGFSNFQPHQCILNRLFRRRSKKTSKLIVTGLCAGNSPVTGEFPAQMARNAEIVSIWWRHHRFSNKTLQPFRLWLGNCMILDIWMQFFIYVVERPINDVNQEVCCTDYAKIHIKRTNATVNNFLIMSARFVNTAKKYQCNLIISCHLNMYTCLYLLNMTHQSIHCFQYSSSNTTTNITKLSWRSLNIHDLTVTS